MLFNMRSVIHQAREGCALTPTVELVNVLLVAVVVVRVATERASVANSMVDGNNFYLKV